MRIPCKHNGYLSDNRRLYHIPKAPDMSGANAAAESGAQVSRDQWEWTKARQPKLDEQSDAMIKMGRDQYDLNRDGQVFQQGLMKKQDDRYWSSVAPMEDKMFSDATNFNTKNRQTELAGLALGDVNQGFSAARDQQDRAESSMGVNPNSGRALATGNQRVVSQANAIANAMNKTRTAARIEGFGRMTDAVAMGKGLSGFNSSTMQGFSSGALGATGVGMSGMATAGNQFHTGATGASNGLQGASQNLRANSIESARTPAFDALMGLAAGGMQAWGMKK